MEEMAKYVWEGFKNGIIHWFSNIPSLVKDKITDPFVDKLKSFLGIHSPSTEAYSLAEYFAMGFNNGLADMTGKSVSTAEKWMGSVTGALSRAGVEIPLTFGMPNAAAYIPRVASGTVAPPKAGVYAASYRNQTREQDEITPASMKRALLEALAEISEKQGGEDINLTLEMDGDVIYEKVVQRNKSRTKISGRNPLLA